MKFFHGVVVILCSLNPIVWGIPAVVRATTLLNVLLRVSHDEKTSSKTISLM